MKYLCVLIIAALFISSVFAGNELQVAIKDHTGAILTSTAIPSTVNIQDFSDFAALVVGFPAKSTESPVPITNTMKRAQATLTVVTMDQLPNTTAGMTLVETNKSQTQAGALVQAITGANKCILGSQSLMSQIYTSNQESLVLSFSSQEAFATAMCGTLPTTGPATTVGKTICATLDKFVGSTDQMYSDESSNSAVAQAVALSNANKFEQLQQQNPGVVVTDDDITINGVVYSRQNQVVNTIVRELAYITNVSALISSFGTATSPEAVDSYTFVISSAQSVQDSKQLIALIERVANYAVAQFATAYSNNLISSIIMAPTQLDGSSVCVVGLGAGSPTGVLEAHAEAVTTEQIRSYQITLWLVIALIATAIVGFASTATMHLFPDPAIQGGMSTYWVTKSKNKQKKCPT